jgi:phage baseplate assembly protein W
MAIYSDIDEQKITSILVEDIASIYQSINNILNTVPGERLFNPEFGVDLASWIFDLMNEANAFSILSEITGAINRWEPRVFVDFGQSSIIPNFDQNRYDINIVFSIVDITDQSFEYSGLLEREPV